MRRLLINNALPSSCGYLYTWFVVVFPANSWFVTVFLLLFPFGLPVGRSRRRFNWFLFKFVGLFLRRWLRVRLFLLLFLLLFEIRRVPVLLLNTFPKHLFTGRIGLNRVTVIGFNWVVRGAALETLLKIILFGRRAGEFDRATVATATAFAVAEAASQKCYKMERKLKFHIRFIKKYRIVYPINAQNWTK